jgi:hypothetical protein
MFTKLQNRLQTRHLQAALRLIIIRKISVQMLLTYTSNRRSNRINVLNA